MSAVLRVNGKVSDAEVGQKEWPIFWTKRSERQLVEVLKVAASFVII